MENTATVINSLADNLGEQQVSDSMSVRVAYGTDNSRAVHIPDIVVWPQNQKDVVNVMLIANALRIPVYPRGRGTATTGASLAEQGGIVLSTEKIHFIQKPDLTTRSITVGPGVLNGELEQVLKPHQLFWPPDPTSRAYCSIGGNLATAAAGPKGVKYGGVRENVLAIRAVTGTGDVVESGANTLKSVAGYDLARLFVGSEGTLGIITQATLKLAPLPRYTAGICASFTDYKSAFDALAKLLATDVTPSACEFLDEACVQLVKPEVSELGENDKVLLLIGFEQESKEKIDADVQTASDAIKKQTQNLIVAEPGTGVWRVRTVLSQYMRTKGANKINEDVAVPVGKLEDLVTTARKLASDAGIDIAIFGHAGVGNLHVNFLFEREQPDTKYKVGKALRQLMEFVVSVDGTISGEHGIGISKRKFLSMQVDATTLRYMRGIKQVFDPNQILNPNKVFALDDYD